MSNVLGLENFQPSVELNSIVPQHKYTEKSPIVEIFTAMVNGNDTSKYGDKVNKAYGYIKKLSTDALAGDGRAKVELNSIVEQYIQAPLSKRLSLFDFMGETQSVAYNERLLFKIYKLQGKTSSFQANQGDVPFSKATWKYDELTTKTISGGMSVNYREMQTGNLDGTGVMAEQTITDMTNKMFYDVLSSLYVGVKNSTGVKHFAEAAGITSASVKDMISKVRRWGKLGILGDYSVVSQLNSMVGFNTDTAGTLAKQLPISVIEEIMRTGLLSTFMGTPVVELPNAYNITSLNSSGDDYSLYLPEGLMFFLVSGEMSPLKVGMRGGLTSATGFSVTTGENMTRFDMEFGSKFIEEYGAMMGLISDSNFPVPTGF